MTPTHQRWSSCETALNLCMLNNHTKPYRVLRHRQKGLKSSDACVTNTRACCNFPECSALTSLSLCVQQGKETQLLHVFEEDLILGSETVDDYLQDSGRISLALITFAVILCCVVNACPLFSSQPDAVLCSLLLGGAGDH